MAEKKFSSLGNIIGKTSSGSGQNLQESPNKDMLAALQDVSSATNELKKPNLLDSFSGLDFVRVPGASEPVVASAASMLLEANRIRQETRKRSLEEQDQALPPAAAAAAVAPKAPLPPLMDQALSSHQKEVTEGLLPEKNLKRNKGRKANISRKARQRKMKGKGRGASYEDRYAAKTSAKVKKNARKHMMKSIY
mmetsp:Transcript_17713/g.25867  ORF Transcript_17713/g.25867 Transcript_17713/m.25867 type:complete len:194 (-) Transcript_17713:34-615(-)